MWTVTFISNSSRKWPVLDVWRRNCGKLTLQINDAGFTVLDNLYLVGNGLLEVNDASLQGFDGFILGGKCGIDCTAVVNRWCGWMRIALSEFGSEHGFVVLTSKPLVIE